MTIELLPTFKTQAILDVYNVLAAPGNQLKDWSKSKTELVARILKMGTTADIEKAIAATEDATLPGKKPAPAKKAGKAKTEKKVKTAKGKSANKTGERKPGIGACAKAIIKASPDMPALDVVAEVQKQFPEANISHKCVGYYRYQMRKAGEIK